MLYRQYKYKFYLNMNHSVEIQGRQGEIHSHTWEISLGIGVGERDFVRFSDIEHHINGLLEQYQDRYLNEIPPFALVNPTLENVCGYLFEMISGSMQAKNWTLLVMEMSETPSRVYQITGLGAAEEYTFV